MRFLTPSHIQIAKLALLAVGCLVTLVFGQFTLSRTTMDGGGEMRASGGDFELSATIGQHDAGVSSGGGFQLSAGFWFEEPVGDCNATGSPDLFDHAEQVDCLTGPDGGLAAPSCNCFDIDNDSDGDLFDVASVQTSF